MHVEDFLGLAKDFADLGWSVQEQFQNIMDGEDLEDQNINALKRINRFMKDCKAAGLEFPDEQDLAVEEYLQEYLEETVDKIRQAW